MRSYKVVGFVTRKQQPNLKYDIVINANSSGDAIKLVRSMYNFGGSAAVVVSSVQEVHINPTGK